MLAPKDLLLYLCTGRVLASGTPDNRNFCGPGDAKIHQCSRLPGRPITEAVEAAIAGGVTMVQLREKDASTGEFYRIALEVRAITRRYHVPLVINDRLDIALAVEAEGLHIGQSDLPLPAARRLAGKKLFIGVSASTVEDALRAEAEGADYLGVGAVYPTGSKADAGEAIGLAGLAAICAAVKIPVAGIGGVNADNAADVKRAGAAGIAVISGILSRPDIGEAARNLRAILDAARGRG